jgi:hypothetical protein
VGLFLFMTQIKISLCLRKPNMSLSSLKGSSPQEAAASANKSVLLTGKFDGAFTYFKYNEEKQAFNFGFFLHEKAKIVFQTVKVASLLAEIDRWPTVDQNDSHWKAMKHISQTVKLADMLYALGRLTPEGNVKGLRSAEGAPLIVNCGASDEGYQQVNISKSKKEAIYEAERVTIEGTPKFNEIVGKIPTNCLAWLYKKFEESSFVTVDPNIYDIEIASYKHTPAVEGKSPAKDGFTLLATLDGVLHGRVYVSFRRNVAEDVQRLQQLASVIGWDDKKYKGTKLRAMIGVAETRDGAEFNTLEMAYSLDTAPNAKAVEGDDAIVTPISDEAPDSEFD